DPLELGPKSRVQLEPGIDLLGVGRDLALVLNNSRACVDSPEDALGELVEPLVHLSFSVHSPRSLIVNERIRKKTKIHCARPSNRKRALLRDSAHPTPIPHPAT